MLVHDPGLKLKSWRERRRRLWRGVGGVWLVERGFEQTLQHFIALGEECKAVILWHADGRRRVCPPGDLW